MADISPNKTNSYADKAVYGFPTLTARTAPSLYSGLINPGVLSLPIQAPYNPANLVIPSNASNNQYKFAFRLAAQARLIAQDAAADQAAYPIKLIEYGNTQFGQYPIKIDGAPLPSGFMPNSDMIELSSIVSVISIASIEATIALGMNMFTPNATFTPDPSSTDWFIEVVLSPIVYAYF